MRISRKTHSWFLISRRSWKEEHFCVRCGLKKSNTNRVISYSIGGKIFWKRAPDCVGNSRVAINNNLSKYKSRRKIVFKKSNYEN